MSSITRHILLAEDNAADEVLVREALREHNVSCNLHVVSDGSQAIRNTADELNALCFFHKPSSLDEFMLLGGIVKGVLHGHAPFARGGA